MRLIVTAAVVSLAVATASTNRQPQKISVTDSAANDNMALAMKL